MLELIKSLFSSEILNSAVRHVTAMTGAIAYSLALIFAVFHAGILAIESIIQKKKPIEVLQSKAGNIVLIVLLYGYASFMAPVDQLIKIAAEHTRPTMTKAQQYYDHLNDVYNKDNSKEEMKPLEKAELSEDVQKDVEEAEKTITKVKDIPAASGDKPTEELSFFDVLSTTPRTISIMVFNGLIGFVITIIKVVMTGISLVLLKLLYIFGPLAIAFSILPVFREKAVVWLGTYLTIALNLVTLNVIDHLFYDVIMGQSASFLNGHSVDSLATTTFNLILIMAYVMSFWITSKWVGSESAGRFMTAAMGAVAGLAKSALGTASGGGGGSSGSASSAAGMATETITKGLKKT